MKKLILPALLFASVLLNSRVYAQVRFNVNQNNAQRPAWGLPGSYAGDFYYLPELDMFYHIPQQQFVYQERGRWIQSTNLPNAYRGYDLYRGPKVAINDREPWMRGNYYRNQYRNLHTAQRRPLVIDNRRRVFDRNNRNDRDDDWDDDWDDRRDNRRDEWDDRRDKWDDKRDKWENKRDKWNDKRYRKYDKKEHKKDHDRRKRDRD